MWKFWYSKICLLSPRLGGTIALFFTEYYSKTFDIPIEKVDDFIYFVQGNAVTPSMLKPENELELLETLFQQSELYKKRTKGQ